VEVWLYAFLTSTVQVSGHLHAPGRFTPGERAPPPHLEKGAGRDVVARRKIPAGNQALVVHPVT